jgi:hypothetical protein
VGGDGLRSGTGPGVLAEAAEFALGGEVNLNVVDNDARVGLAFAVFKGPEFFAVFVGDGNGFAFPGDKGALGTRSFDKKWRSLCKGEIRSCSCLSGRIDTNCTNGHEFPEDAEDLPVGRPGALPGGYPDGSGLRSTLRRRRSVVGLSGQRTRDSGVEGWRTGVIALEDGDARGDRPSTLNAIRGFWC